MSIDPTTFFQSIFGNTPIVGILVWAVFIFLVIVVLIKAWPIVKKFVHTIDALGDLPEALTKLDSIQDELKVLEELRPNHGGSIRDQITKINHQVHNTDKKLSEHITLCKIAESIAGFDESE